jgi:hypothetical protein
MGAPKLSTSHQAVSNLFKQTCISDELNLKKLTLYSAFVSDLTPGRIECQDLLLLNAVKVLILTLDWALWSVVAYTSQLLFRTVTPSKGPLNGHSLGYLVYLPKFLFYIIRYLKYLLASKDIEVNISGVYVEETGT